MMHYNKYKNYKLRRQEYARGTDWADQLGECIRAGVQIDSSGIIMKDII